MAPWLICCFIVMLFYIDRKLLLMRIFSIILPLMFKLPKKFQRFNATDRSMADIFN